MIRALLLMATLASASPASSGGDRRSSTAPAYSAASIVNSASFSPDALAPNTVATVFGSNLSWSEAKLGASDIQGNALPTELAGVHVLVGITPAHLYYVSAGQINFLVPNFLRAGPMDVTVVRDGVSGPAIRVNISETAAALFTTAAGSAIVATHADGSIVNEVSPAAPGEVVVLYATGLGYTNVQLPDGHLADSANVISKLSAFVLWLNGDAVERERILYAGVTPGFAGLYQINLRLPDPLAHNPEVRIGFDGSMSPAKTVLLTR